MNNKIEETVKAQKAKAEAVLKEVQAHPDNFSAIAKRESDDKLSAERGGELGFFTKEKMVPEFSKAAFEMKPNTISALMLPIQPARLMAIRCPSHYPAKPALNLQLIPRYGTTSLENTTRITMARFS